MGDANPIRTLGVYSKPSHEGYRNTIELPEGNNVVPLRSDTIWERTRLCLFQFSLHDQASNWLERLSAGSITTWKDLTTHFLAQFIPPRRTVKLHNDILIYPEYIRRCLIKLENQVQRLMEAHLALMQPTQVNKITSSCEICSGPHDTQYCMENPEQAFIDYASSRTDKTRSRIPAAQMNFTSTNDPTKEELRGKGIKSPSKLLSLKYLSQSSLAEQNRNPSSPKCVHFVNLIVILNKEDEAKEEGNVKSSTTEYEDHKMSVESEEEFKEETKEEIKEEEEDSPRHFDTFPIMKELKYHEWLLKNPQPPWVKAKIKLGT
ncbi:MAK10-like protein [Tanacetum coccineum]